MKHRYEIIMYWSNEEGAVIAEIPELAGCIADGVDYSEALKNVEIVIQHWLETAQQAIPVPKGKLMYA